MLSAIGEQTAAEKSTDSTLSEVAMRNSTILASPIYFNVAEYCLFGITLCVVVGVIFHFVFVNKKNDTVSGFLFGGKNMSTVSVSFALIAR